MQIENFNKMDSNKWNSIMSSSNFEIITQKTLIFNERWTLQSRWFLGFCSKKMVMDSLLIIIFKIIFTNLGQAILSKGMIIDIYDNVFWNCDYMKL
jgi:hypothetical protein